MSSYTRFPLVQKALAEQAAIFARAEDGMPADLIMATARTLALIDSHVTTTDEIKQCLLTVGVLMHCPPYIALKSSRFAADYHPHVQAMLDRHMQGHGVTAANTDLVQVYSAMFIAHAENLQRHIASVEAPSRLWLQDMRESLEEYASDRQVFEAGLVPGLKKIEDKIIADTLGVIDAALAKMTPARKPKTGGPKR